MAVRYAVNSSLWSSGATWDDGIGPLSGDTVHPNGYTIIIDTDINVASLNNNVSSVYLPNMSIPLMTSNTAPSGVVNASGGNTTAYYAFDQNSGTIWDNGSFSSGWISYQFPTQKVIKRYRVVGYQNGTPKNFIFQGSNNGSIWDDLDAVTNNISAVYLSGAIMAANVTPYFYYRLFVTATQNATNNVIIYSIEMTEDATASYGATGGGTFTVPASLVGTRNITFNGDGIRIAGSTTCINIAATTGATVNFNKISGGEIFKPIWSVSNGTNGRGVSINGNCAVVFNGNIQGTTANAYNDGASGNIYINAAANVRIFGNVIAPTISPTYPSFLIQSAAGTSNNAILNINGNIISGLQSTTYALYLNGINTLNLVGDINATQGYSINATNILYLNITGTTSYTNASSITPIITAGASVINIIGDITAPPNAVALSCGTGAATVNVPTGTITAGINGVGIYAPSSSLVTVAGPLINANNSMAICASKIRFYSGQTVQWTFQDTTNSNIILSSISSSGVTIGLPFSGDVRYLTTYGQNNEYVGSLRVPTIDNVRKGVPFDYTVGTADLTANDIFNAISGSSNSVAVRLRNVSTVQSAGDQIAGLS